MNLTRLSRLYVGGAFAALIASGTGVAIGAPVTTFSRIAELKAMLASTIERGECRAALQVWNTLTTESAILSANMVASIAPFDYRPDDGLDASGSDIGRNVLTELVTMKSDMLDADLSVTDCMIEEGLSKEAAETLATALRSIDPSDTARWERARTKLWALIGYAQ